MCHFSVLFSTVYARKGILAKIKKFLLQVKYEQPRLTMSHACRLDCLISEFPHGTQLRSLLDCQNIKLVYAKMALKTSGTVFAFTRQACTAILAVISVPYSNNTKRIQTIQNVRIFR